MGKHWLSFDSIWYLRVSVELSPSLSAYLDPSAISCALLLPCPSGLCVSGKWIGSSLLFLKKTKVMDRANNNLEIRIKLQLRHCMDLC